MPKVDIFTQKTIKYFQILNFISTFATKMAGLYIHIPFCASRCIYCGFYSTTRLELRQRYVDAVCKEWEERKYELTEPIHTIYIGGGTPSQLSKGQLAQLFACFPVAEEVTLECNPDDVTPSFAAMLAALPVNRISMGAQTFDDSRLRFLHRRHTAGQVPTAVKRLRDVGIKNISIDLMYGFPNETLADWQRDIEAALALNVEHLSAYSLMYEEDTPLHRMLKKGEIEELEEEDSLAMYDVLIDRLAAAGYEHYEISNFAKAGKRSRHNSSYWQQTPYVGLGAAAHSYDGQSRQWNISDVAAYIKGVEEKKSVVEERELLDADTQYNDRVMLSLRTAEGLDLNTLSARHREHCKALAGKFLNQGLLRESGSRLRLTRQGLFVSDMVMSELMWV